MAKSLTLVLLLVATFFPAVSAYPQPAIYFFKDGEMGPLEEGVLNETGPDANATRPQVRPIVPLQENVEEVMFLTPADENHTDRLLGPIILGIWLGPTFTPYGNLTATIYEIPATGDPVAIGNMSTILDFNSSKYPEPMDLVPPESTDPATIIFYEYFMLYPALYAPPIVLYIPFVDVAIGNASRIGVAFHISPGSSPGPVPVAAFATLEYNLIGNSAAFVPPALTFAYLPWYAPDPPRPTYSYTYTPPTDSTSTRTATGQDPTNDDDGGGKGAPGFGLPFTIIGLAGVAAFAVRRKLR